MNRMGSSLKDFSPYDMASLKDYLAKAGWLNGINLVNQSDAWIHFSMDGHKKMQEFIQLLISLFPNLFGSPAKIPETIDLAALMKESSEENDKLKQFIIRNFESPFPQIGN